MLLLFAAASVTGQSLNSTNGGFPATKVIDGKKFHVLYYEHVVDKTPEEVWEEVAMNYTKVARVSKAITGSHCESEGVTSGLGSKRYCAIDFGKKKVEVKEEVVDYKISDKRNEFTYVVYESKGFPAEVYNTWVVRVGDDGKTYLGTAFIMRANMSFMTGMLAKKLLKQGGVKNGVLSYKHYLETGEGNVDGVKLAEMYPEQL